MVESLRFIAPRGAKLWLTLASVMAVVGTRFEAAGDVVVLANRSGVPLAAQVGSARGLPRNVQLSPGESLPVFLEGRGSISFSTGSHTKRYELDANCAYYFGRTSDGRIDLQRIGLGEDESTTGGRTLSGGTNRNGSAVIPVKILVDEDEPARQAIWERRLRSRVEAASAILDKHCRVQLKVVGTGTWNSDNSITDFFASLDEFEREVDPGSARLAIGFTSQFQVLRGRVHMAGTRGPLRSHILLREFSPKIDEPERLEFLLHELGHHMGASHSPEATSVMRPVLGDNLAGRANFQIRFDPVNTLIMSLVGEEIRHRGIRNFGEITNESKLRLRQIYGHLAKTLPDDPAGNHFLSLTRDATAGPKVAPLSSDLFQGIRHVLKRIGDAAEANSRLPAGEEERQQPKTALQLAELGDSGDSKPIIGGTTSGEGNGAARRSGDALMEYYIREASGAADDLPAGIAPKAFLLAIGIALDDSGALATLPITAPIVRAVDSNSDRETRQRHFGAPTMQGRADLAKHFAVSACLTDVLGTEAARVAGLTKETLDSQGGSGFSFADMCANQAGITFAEYILKERFSMSMISNSFTVALVMPPVDGLEEGLSSKELLSKFGPASDKRFRHQMELIEQRIRQLPPYRVATGTAPR